MEQLGKDNLKDLFVRMPEDELPLGFQTKMMELIRKEILLAERRQERMDFWVPFSIGLVFVGVAIAIFAYFGISLHLPSFNFDFLQSYTFRFSLYIGFLAFILLLLDPIFHKAYNKRHPS